MGNYFLPNSNMTRASQGLVLFGISLVIAMLTQSSVGGPIGLSIDDSWQFALNYFSLHDLILGRDVFFTHGPLGYLLWPKPLAHHLFIAALFWFFLKLLLIISVFSLALQLNNNQKLIYKVLIFILSYFFFAAVHISLLFFLNVTWLLLFNARQQKFYLYLATAITILAFLIKPGLAVYTILASYSFLCIDALIHKRYRLIIKITLAHVLMYFISWLLVLGSFAGSLGFLSSSWEFMKGYDAAMSLDKPICWVYLGGAYLIVILSFLPFLGRPILAKNGVIIFIILLLPTLLYFKYSYNRLNEHIYFITVFLTLFYCFMLILIADIWRFLILLLLGLGATQFQIASQSYLGYPIPNLEIASTNGKYFFQQILHPKTYKNQLLELSQQKLNRLNLDLANLKIKDANFAIYPNNSAIIFAKQLSWQPQPIPQSYTNYTAKLDNINARFFRQDKGADYIIWHSANTLAEIDQRYLLNSEPNTSFEILNRYQAFKALPNYLILKKNQLKQWTDPRVFQKDRSHWNTWISVPNNSYAMVRARLITKEQWLEKIKRLIYKQTPVWIDYQFNNGSIETYRLILATAENGIWIKPFIHALSNQLEVLESLPITSPKELTVKYQLEKIANINGFLQITGWGYIEQRDIQNQIFNLILTHNNTHYIYSAKSIARTELQSKLKKMVSNPEYLGFNSRINLQQLPPGDYQLALYLTNGQDKAVVSTGQKITITAADKKIDSLVTKIRIRHPDYDFFHNKVIIEWLGSTKIKSPANDS